MSGCIDLGSEHLCYVHCSFCSTILAVNVPSSSLFKIVTVRCGHCSHLLSVNMGASSVPLESLQNQNDSSKGLACSSSGSSSGKTVKSYAGSETAKTLSAPEKRQRIPSAYNRFIKEEIQRIKANNPDIRHKEAFSAAAKNWAHFPDIHFGQKLEKNKQAMIQKEDEQVIITDTLCAMNNPRMEQTSTDCGYPVGLNLLSLRGIQIRKG